QRRGREGWRRSLHAGLLLDTRDRPRHVRANRGCERARSVRIEQPHVLVLQLAGLGVEILAGRDALIVDARERGDELTSPAAQLRLEVPVDRRPERAALFLA